MAYARRYVGGFVDKPAQTTPIDSIFLDAVEAALLKLYALDPTDGQIMSWVAANTRMEPTFIKNANIDPAAAIAKSKLAALAITDADIAGGAGIAQSKLALALVQPTNFAPGSKITTSTLAGGPPASPADGDIWIATGVDANGTRWMFQYNAGASTYKWEFIGGAALQAHANPVANFTSAAVALRTTGLRPGTYIARQWGMVGVTAGAYVQFGGSVDNGLSQYNGNFVAQQSNLSGTSAYETVSVENTFTTSTGEIDVICACGAGGTVTLYNVHQALTPVRIS